MRRRNPPLLVSVRSDGGGVVLTKDRAHYLLQRIGFVKRRLPQREKHSGRYCYSKMGFLN